MKTFPFSVCIFDVNGVLIDSNQANARAMGEAFSDDPETRDRIARSYLQMTGINRGEKIRRIQVQVIGRPFEPGEPEARWEKFRTLAHEAMTMAPLAPGAKDVLGELAERRVRLVALSNTPLAELQEILKVHGLREFLDIVRGGGNWPKSESLLRLLEEFQLPRAECLFLGDGKGDLHAARYAGVRFVAIDGGTGEFSNEQGFDGPYRDLEAWGAKVLGIRAPKEGMSLPAGNR